MISYSKILPLLIIVAIISFSVRLTEVVTGISNISSSAYAKAAEEEKAQLGTDAHADKGKGEKLAEAETSETGGHETGDGAMAEGGDQETLGHEGDGHEGEGDVETVEGKDARAPKWQDASDSNLDIAGIKLEMFEDLSERRARLEETEKALQVREALLKAAEQEVERKVTELKGLREEIKGLLEEQGGQEAERIDSLVKIYEGMKPKDAARIFDTLDIDVLVRVMSKMSERKVAPVLAAMNAERARTVTIMLAEQKTLPAIE